MRGVTAKSSGQWRRSDKAWQGLFNSPSGEVAVLVLNYAGAVGGQFFANDNNALTFDDLHTFTRASTATVVDSAGFIINSPTGTKRLDHDKDGNRLGLLIEGARTNLFLQSADISTTWGNTGSSELTNIVVAPDGTMTGDALIASAGVGGHNVFQAITLASATNAVFTCYFKAGVVSNGCMNYEVSANNYIAAVFDLTGGDGVASETSVGSGSGTLVSTGIKDVGNGWLRCSMVGKVTGANGIGRAGVAEAATGNTFTNVGQVTYDAPGTETILMWGLGAEVGAFPSSYIPTTTVAVTRAAETCSIAVADWAYSQSTGSWFIHLAKDDVSEAGIHDSLTTGLGSMFIGPSRLSGGLHKLFLRDNGANGFSNTTIPFNPTDGVFYKAAIAWTSGSAAASYNGAASLTSGAIGTVTGAVTYSIGGFVGGNIWNGHIKEIANYSERLSNADLEVLST